MEKIYSKQEPEELLHIIVRKDEDFEKENNFISPEKEFLQLGTARWNKGKIIKSHAHNEQSREVTRTQESVIVIQGRVKVRFYDFNDEVIKESVLETGDCSITFKGGHGYEALDDETKVYEYKTGPYLGLSNDKRIIE